MAQGSPRFTPADRVLILLTLLGAARQVALRAGDVMAVRKPLVGLRHGGLRGHSGALAPRARALSITDIADVAYELEGRRATREQRLSATRAAHNVLRRVSGTAALGSALTEVGRHGWMASTVGRRLLFHPDDLPLQVWAVSIQPAGVIWADAETIAGRASWSFSLDRTMSTAMRRET